MKTRFNIIYLRVLAINNTFNNIHDDNNVDQIEEKKMKDLFSREKKQG